MKLEDMYNKEKDQIAIFLATYNGEKYIRQQIDSIRNQTYNNWKLWIRDDMSKDNTVNIIKNYIKIDKRINMLNSGGENLGPCLNFNKLMENVKYDNYVMFCDQDDVWLSQKIEKTYHEMKKIENKYNTNIPILIHTDYKIVDKNLKIIANYGHKYMKIKYCSNSLNQLLGYNFMWGCTMMANRSLIEKCTPIPVEAENHDYWIGLVAATIGKVVYLNEATMMYRQHENNVTGGVYKNRLFKWINKLFFGWNDLNKRINNSLIQAILIKNRYYNLFSKNDRKMIDDFILYTKLGGIKSIVNAIKYNINRPGILRSIIFYITLLKKRYII
jgi:rhamnosyltransferase